MLFKASLDKTAKVITILFTLSFAFIIAAQFLINDGNNSYRSLFVTIILLVLYCLAFVFHPTAYKITSDLLIIYRPVGKVQIKRKTIQNVAVIDDKEISNAIRTFGVGGVFGYYGSFANYHLGSMTWYATRKDRAVLITTNENKKIVVTPNEPDSFIAAFNA
jgi:Bacterial PH domain